MKHLISPVVLAAALLAFSPIVNAQTIINGSFEDTSGMTGSINFMGVPIGWTYTDASGFTAPHIPTVQAINKDWSSSATTITSAYYPENVDGNYYMEGTGKLSSPYDDTDDWSQGTLWQDVSGLTVGQEYRLDFLWGNRWHMNDWSDPVSYAAYDFTISMGGEEFSRNGDEGIGLLADHIIFIASDTTERLSIEMKHTQSQTNGAFDNFVLSPTPEPSGALLVALTGALALLRRRRA